jgi:hypothetical protein
MGLKTPSLIQFARDFYQCPNVDVIPLENDGGEGSVGAHFERAIFMDENMTASDVQDEAFSGFSYSLLRDSGWYGIDEKYYETF